MNIEARLSAALAQPLTHVVKTIYAHGEVREHFARSASAAETWAMGERRKIGASLQERDRTTLALTGRTIKVIDVRVSLVA